MKVNIVKDYWRKKTLLSFLLLPFSLAYYLVYKLRFYFYRSGLFKIKIWEVPIVVVGNITVGGTGKTPFTAYLCQLLGSYGYSVCILTRGYGGKQKGPLIADPNAHSAADIGDEALMLSQNNLVCISCRFCVFRFSSK